MKAPGTILLVAAGPRRHTPAMQRAFDLARQRRAPVHVLLPAFDALIERSATLVHPEIRRLAQQQFLDERHAWLDQLVARWNADGISATGEVLWTPALHEAVLARCVEMEPALVVKDTIPAARRQRALLGHHDWRLARYCPVPLLLVHERSDHRPRRIVAAVDTSPAEPGAAELNARIVLEAAGQADGGDVEVHLAHVFPYLPLEHVPYQTLDHVQAMARAADTGAFRAFAAAQHVPEERRHWLEGDAAERLAELVEQQPFDVLVLGSTHRSALDRLFLGSTSEALIGRVRCDVLLVRPRHFAQELRLHLDTRAVARRVMESADPASGKVRLLRPN